MRANRFGRLVLILLVSTVFALLSPPVEAGPGGGTDILIGGSTVDPADPGLDDLVADVAVDPYDSWMGVVLLEGMIFTLDCGQLQENRDGSRAFFARASSGPMTRYLKLDGIEGQGLSSVMGGVSERASSSSQDRCGAAFTATNVEYLVVVVG